MNEAFESEFNLLPEDTQDELLAYTKLLEQFGHSLRRPYADTLNGSRYTNMKELRFKVPSGVWRIAFAFDPQREAILLVAGNKVQKSSRRFDQQLITIADKRFDDHLKQLKHQGT